MCVFLFLVVCVFVGVCVSVSGCVCDCVCVFVRGCDFGITCVCVRLDMCVCVLVMACVFLKVLCFACGIVEFELDVISVLCCLRSGLTVVELCSLKVTPWGRCGTTAPSPWSSPGRCGATAPFHVPCLAGWCTTVPNPARPPL